MSDRHTVVEASKQLIATARDIVEESRRLRAQAKSSARHSQRILVSSRDRAAVAPVAKLSTEPDPERD